MACISFQGGYDNSFPKFRYTGTVGSGGVHPVIFTKEIINVDAVINGGVFLCMKPGFYHFSAVLNPVGGHKVDIEIFHNSRKVMGNT